MTMKMSEPMRTSMRPTLSSRCFISAGAYTAACAHSRPQRDLESARTQAQACGARGAHIAHLEKAQDAHELEHAQDAYELDDLCGSEELHEAGGAVGEDHVERHSGEQVDEKEAPCIVHRDLDLARLKHVGALVRDVGGAKVERDVECKGAVHDALPDACAVCAALNHSTDTDGACHLVRLTRRCSGCHRCLNPPMNTGGEAH